MKKKLYKGLLLVLGIAVFLLPIAITRADSGFDSSYSGGGGSYHSSGGSSSHSSSHYHSSSSSGSYSGDGSLAPVIIGIVILIIIFIIIANSKGGGSSNYYATTLMSQDEIDKIDNTIKIDELMDYTFDLFVKVQKAWTDFKYDELRNYLSDELFNNYKMQLETLELEMGKNIMDDFKYIDGGVVSVKKNDLTEEVIVKLHVTMKDYIINTTDNSIKNGDPNKTMDINYFITLERSIRSEIHNCPNCGGELKDTASQKCPYCDAVLVKGSKDFIMVKKENKQQRY